jgi:hypothetical protein
MLQNVSAVASGPNQITVSGTVQDANLNGVVITFSGVASGLTTPNANGTFSVTLSASHIGAETVSVSDGDAFTMTKTVVVDAGPVITSFTAQASSGNMWIFTGTVSGATGGTITLTGLPELNNVTVTIQPDGTFTVGIVLSPADTGTVSAVATDTFGNQSNTAYAYVG